MFQDLRQSLETVRSLVDVVASHADRRDDIVADLILANHPLFTTLRRAMDVPYRFIFEDKDEFGKWIKNRGFTEDIFDTDENYEEWFKSNKATGSTEVLKVSKQLFDEAGKLKPFSSTEWSDSFVSFEVRRPKKAVSIVDLDDDVPF